MKTALKIKQAGKRNCSILLNSQSYAINLILGFIKLLMPENTLIKFFQIQTLLLILFSQISKLSLATTKFTLSPQIVFLLNNQVYRN